MRLQDILSMVREYLGLGIVLMVAVALLMLIGYGIIYNDDIMKKYFAPFKIKDFITLLITIVIGFALIMISLRCPQKSVQD